MAEVKFSNPINDDADAAPVSPTSYDAAVATGVSPKSAVNYASKKGNVGWLKRREGYQADREAKHQLNYKYDPNLNEETGGLLDLGCVAAR